MVDSLCWRDGREAEGAPLLREYGVKNLIEGSNPSLSASRIHVNDAPVAQLDRVPGYEPGGREFESLRAHQYWGSIGLLEIVFKKACKTRHTNLSYDTEIR